MILLINSRENLVISFKQGVYYSLLQKQKVLITNFRSCTPNFDKDYQSLTNLNLKIIRFKYYLDSKNIQTSLLYKFYSTKIKRVSTFTKFNFLLNNNSRVNSLNLINVNPRLSDYLQNTEFGYYRENYDNTKLQIRV